MSNLNIVFYFPMTLSALKIALVYPNLMDDSQQYAMRDERIGVLKGCLESRGLSPNLFARNELPELLDDFDLVVAAGGDGTQLDVARRMTDRDNCRLCAVRLNPGRSVGYLCNIDFEDFIHKIETTDLNDIYHLQFENIIRLQCIVDGIPLSEPILNDVLFANKCPARASKYIFELNGIQEKHCSSGIWVATQSGSHGASKSAGAVPLDDSDKSGCVYCVREIGQRVVLSASNTMLHDLHGRFQPDIDSLLVKSLTFNHALFFDGGLSSYPLDVSQVVSFGYHPAVLKRIVLV